MNDTLNDTLFIVNNYSQQYTGKSFDYLLRYAIRSPLRFRHIVVLKPTEEHVLRLRSQLKASSGIRAGIRAGIRVMLSGSDYNVDADDCASKSVLKANLDICRMADADPALRLFAICYGAQALLISKGLQPVVHKKPCKGFYQICRAHQQETEPLTVWSNHSRTFAIGMEVEVLYTYCTGIGKTRGIEYCQGAQVYRTKQGNSVGTVFHPEVLPTTHFLIDDFFQRP